MNPRRKFTEEEIAWLKDMRAKYGVPKITEMYNEKYGTSYTPDTLKSRMLLKGIKASNKRTFGHYVHSIGDTRISRGKYAYVKVANFTREDFPELTSVEISKKNWRPKSKVMYEKHYGVKVEPDEIVMFLDGDTFNFEKENLIKVKEAVFHKYNSYHARSIDPELTRTALQLCELALLLKK